MSYNHPGFALRHPFPEPRPNSKYGWHGGADYGAKEGTEVPAEYSGKVLRSGPIYGYGNTVIVESKAANGSPFYTLYGHLGPGPLPEPGAPVTAGKTILGAVGSEAYVNAFPGARIKGTHLHLEIIDGRAQLHKTGNLGLVSSDLTYRANPETFDIHNPTFPYESGGTPPRPAQNGVGAKPPALAPTAPVAPNSPFGRPPTGSNTPRASKPPSTIGPPLDITPFQFRNRPLGNSARSHCQVLAVQGRISWGLETASPEIPRSRWFRHQVRSATVARPLRPRSPSMAMRQIKPAAAMTSAVYGPRPDNTWAGKRGECRP
jgi:murein DD-endopeptidase MepM/ murein hydrolase activator NlpD